MLNAVMFIGTTLSENVNLFGRFGKRKQVTCSRCARIGMSVLSGRPLDDAISTSK